MTAEPALKIVETEPVEEKALSIVDQAKAVKVTDPETYTAAGSLWKSIGDMIKEVKDTFDPICEAAHRDAEKENAALKAERDGYRNGQMQMQDINAKLIDANNALHAEIEKLRIKEAMEASHE